MTSWKQAFSRALWSGSSAAVLSAVALAICGKLERNSAAAPLNGPSQWLWGESAGARRRASVRETVSGYIVHHAVSVGWATLHEKYAARRGRSLGQDMLAAALTGAMACFMDYAVARGRLRPGFEKHLGKSSLAVVYGAFALGLALDRSRATAAAGRAAQVVHRESAARLSALGAGLRNATQGVRRRAVRSLRPTARDIAQ